MSENVGKWLASLYQCEIEKVTAEMENENTDTEDKEEYIGVLQELLDDLIVCR